MIEINFLDLADPSTAFDKEWILTNGLGGFASGTVSQLFTRRYHGYLIAAVKPPTERRVFLSKLEETVCIGQESFSLSCNQWGEEWEIDCAGLKYLDRFVLGDNSCYWDYRVGEGIVRKTLSLYEHQNTVSVNYSWFGSHQNATLNVKVLINNRDLHAQSRVGSFSVDVRQIAEKIRINYLHSPYQLFVDVDGATFENSSQWYKGYFWRVENYRGLDDLDANFMIGTLNFTLDPGQEKTFFYSTDEIDKIQDNSGSNKTRKTETKEKYPYISLLRHAADQFIVRRATQIDPEGRSIIAGYHWFTDWGRDTMISLPGLTLATGKLKLEETILRTYAQYIDRGMIPNRFPDYGETPEYNTVDATLWFFIAIDKYIQKSGDFALLQDLYPVLESIIDWHIRGTRYKIKLDPEDGLLSAGEEGVQLTWMDAKVDDWVVTPRIGKPVEVNALWYSAIMIMEKYSRMMDIDSKRYLEMGMLFRNHIQKFWNSELGYCYDVIDGPGGNDPSLRPNQLFLISLTDDILSKVQRKAIVDICEKKLLTPVGLRSLSADDPEYIGTYGGGIRERDGAYHQGTVWAWLVGPFFSAHWKIYRDKKRIVEYLRELKTELYRHGLGTISEIYDGDPPHHPRGAIAQAWSVAEVLRLIDELGIEYYEEEKHV